VIRQGKRGEKRSSTKKLLWGRNLKLNYLSEKGSWTSINREKESLLEVGLECLNAFSKRQAGEK